jgi:tRNA-specific 2-thiouridylase
MRFPLGELTKPQVREMAAAAGLAVAGKADSQDLCFLAGTDRTRFLARHGGRRSRPGQIVDADGRVVGTHGGQEAFTVGQRRGLGVAHGEPLYVLARDATANRVVVGPRRQLVAERVRLRGALLRRDGARVNRVKLRYRSAPVACRPLTGIRAGAHDALTLELEEPVLGAAPGQIACLMDGDLVLGWGTIAASGAEEGR